MSQAPGIDRVCVHCGNVVAPDRKRLCDHCGRPFAGDTDPYDALVEGNPATIVRTYRGKQQADAVTAFRQDAEILAGRGYAPTSQSWAPGQWGCGAFLLALLLAVVIVGILIFIYMLVVKPEGTLTVTYSRSPAGAGAPVTEAPGLPANLVDRLAQLDQARDAGLITAEEHADKRQNILDSL